MDHFTIILRFKRGGIQNELNTLSSTLSILINAMDIFLYSVSCIPSPGMCAKDET